MTNDFTDRTWCLWQREDGLFELRYFEPGNVPAGFTAVKVIAVMKQFSVVVTDGPVP